MSFMNGYLVDPRIDPSKAYSTYSYACKKFLNNNETYCGFIRCVTMLNEIREDLELDSTEFGVGMQEWDGNQITIAYGISRTNKIDVACLERYDEAKAIVVSLLKECGIPYWERKYKELWKNLDSV